MDLESFISRCQPLDVIFFSGSGFVSKMIQFGQDLDGKNISKVKWSHVGVVVDTSIMPNIRNGIAGEKYIWESTYSGQFPGHSEFNTVPDIESGECVFGIQIRPLKDVLITYLKPKNTFVARFPLKDNPIVNADKEMRRSIISRLEILHRDFYHRGYENSPVDCLSFVIPCCRPFRSCFGTKDLIVCSEFTTIMLQKLGILEQDINPRNMTPKSLSLLPIWK